MEPDNTNACVVGHVGVVVPQSRTQSFQRRCSFQFRMCGRQFVKAKLFDVVNHAVETAVTVVIFEDKEGGTDFHGVPVPGGGRLQHRSGCARSMRC